MKISNGVLVALVCFPLVAECEMSQRFGYRCDSASDSLEIIQLVVEDGEEYLQTDPSVNPANYEVIDPARLLSTSKVEGQEYWDMSKTEVRDCDIPSGTYRVTFSGSAGGNRPDHRCGAAISGAVTVTAIKLHVYEQAFQGQEIGGTERTFSASPE